MNNAPKNNGLTVVSAVIVLIYAAVSSLSLVMNDDDFLWRAVDNYAVLSSYRNPNGRYFSNFVTLELVKYPTFRIVFVFAVLSLLIFLIAQLIRIDNKRLTYVLTFSLSAFILIPSSTYSETVCWISGFTNYVFTGVLILLYLLLTFDVLFSEKSFKPYCLVLFPAIALAGGLSVEHVAVYNVILGAAVVVLLRIKRKKFFAAPLLYLVASLAAAYLVFTNKVYSSISNGNDDFGNRRFQFDFSDLFMNTIRFVIPNYIKSFWIINILIALSIVILYNKRRDVRSKYAPICLVIVILYAVYSVSCSVYSDLAFLEPAMKIRGFETAFAFLYIVALAYFIWLFFGADKRIRLYVFLLSTVLLTAPFMFISPCTPRCFMLDYIFWILLGGELFFSAAAELRNINSRLAAAVSLSAAAGLTALILNIEVTNCYYAHERYDFISEQINSGKENNILVVNYPYPAYVHDDMSNPATFDEISAEGETFTFFEFMGDYYGFDGTGYSMGDFSHISALDYRLLQDSE